MGAVLVTMRIVSKLKYSWSKTVMKIVYKIIQGVHKKLNWLCIFVFYTTN